MGTRRDKVDLKRSEKPTMQCVTASKRKTVIASTLGGGMWYRCSFPCRFRIIPRNGHRARTRPRSGAYKRRAAQVGWVPNPSSFTLLAS